MFKIIGIEILENKINLEPREEARYKSIHKILKPGMYSFYNGYEIKCNNESEFFSIENVNQEIPIDFFNLKSNKVSENGFDINVCSIVGENGSGKSSLIELIIRTINNLSYAIIGANRSSITSNELQFIDNIYIRLYFQTRNDDNLVVFKKIVQHGKKIEIYESNNKKSYFSWLFGQRAQSQERMKKLLSDFAYSIIINYSNYSYNLYDMYPEWAEPPRMDSKKNVLPDDDQCWLNGIFHKNDAYQTPIVLNPYRHNGMIDYNNERNLSRDRLFLLLLQTNNKNEPIFREIVKGKEAYAFVFDISDLNTELPNHPHVTRNINFITKYFNSKEFNLISTYNAVIDSWSNCFGVDLNNCHKSSKDRQQAINYLFYKTLKCVKNYTKYNSFKDNINDKKEIERLVKLLYNDHSHITTKIRRTVAYLIFNHYKTGNEDILINDFSLETKKLVENQLLLIDQIKIQYRSKTEYYKTKYKWTVEDLLPSPFLNTTIKLRNLQNNEGDIQNVMPFDSLSSGEKQMIYSLSTILYHIKNIDSVWDISTENDSTTNIQYKNINLILDELELYFHPKYQIDLVAFLINSLSNLNIKHIKSVNVIFSTHSPFILTDIPLQNTMLLEKGKPIDKSKMKNTFGSNIYDILSDSFFLKENPIGSFAKEKIDEIFDLIKSNEITNKSNDELDDIKRCISLIGEPFIRNYLLRKLDYAIPKTR